MCSNIQAGTSTRRQGSTTWIPATFAFNAILAHIPQILQGKRVAYEVKSNTRESARYPDHLHTGPQSERKCPGVG
jgi:hypothetical protein